MIPGTLLGLVALAAALGPGYLFVRRAERHHNRPVQSQLGELVEMVVIGGAASLLAAGTVGGIVLSKGFIDGTALREDAVAYVVNQPWRCFATAAAFYALAYLITFGASLAVHRKGPSAIVPGLSGWTQAMRAEVPHGKVVVVRVELSDGRRLAGRLGGFTSALEARREIVLRAPIKVVTAGGLAVELIDDYLTVCEEDITLLSGSYVEP